MYKRQILWSYFAKDQGPKNFDVLVTKDGSSWETVANSGDITWKQNPADREQQQKEIVFDSVQEDILGLRIYVNSSYDANWGVNAVITELQIFGTVSYTHLYMLYAKNSQVEIPEGYSYPDDQDPWRTIVVKDGVPNPAEVTFEVVAE